MFKLEIMWPDEVYFKKCGINRETLTEAVVIANDLRLHILRPGAMVRVVDSNDRAVWHEGKMTGD